VNAEARAQTRAGA